MSVPLKSNFAKRTIFFFDKLKQIPFTGWSVDQKKLVLKKMLINN
ncbi:hypothetical protein [Klebsiella pneumoniae IS46]|nr:hypothetical protein [Klebsiella pneumoniae IS46]